MKFSSSIVVALALLVFAYYIIDKGGLNAWGWGWCIFGAILIAVRQTDVDESEHCQYDHCEGCNCEDEDEE